MMNYSMRNKFLIIIDTMRSKNKFLVYIFKSYYSKGGLYLQI